MNKDIFAHKWHYALATGILMVFISGCGSGTVEEMLVPVETVSQVQEETTALPEPEEAELEEVPVAELVYDYGTFDAVEPLSSQAFFEREPIKGIYVSGHVAGITSWMDSLIELADETEINAFVIDVKDDDGRISYETDIKAVNDIGAGTTHIRDIDDLMDQLYQHDIYPIARIVTFKDPYLAKNKQEYAIKNKDGSLWYYKNVPWLNPYNRDTWDYVLDVAKDAAKKGFKEIQFDYIRFEATSSLNNASFGGLEESLSRQDIIYEFVQYAMDELKPYGVEVSADVFGTIITSERDASVIGQDYVKMASELDVICPMVYPSHYGYGFYGTPAGQHSDLYPYRIIKGSMDDSSERIAEIPEGDHRAIVRPWLQAFTASYLGSGNYMVYGKEAIRDQIQATYDAGLEEWILWHAGVKYKESYLLPEEEDQE